MDECFRTTANMDSNEYVIEQVGQAMVDNLRYQSVSYLKCGR